MLWYSKQMRRLLSKWWLLIPTPGGHLHWSPPGEISANGCWVFFDGPWMYVGDTLRALVWQMVTEWRHDRHLVG